ncbi:VWA domain-containing protein [Porphyromonas sp. oral taxon 275]|uniref:VWA domain-containing protein n=1 Tax=Porphyromonas sp. oral taxon 275 TaxID=712435 RepID=UPI001BA5799D|nr:VWA domain-containing protein [Porphyromonas sp. oral taxon 275]QUB43132.1 VWA domain-containing protein [Porphyromonas sp. oral taxon 275]
MHRFSQWIGAEAARQALILTLLRRQGASLLLSGTSGSGKSMLLSCVAAMYPDEVSYLPLSLSPEMLYPSYTLGAEGGLRWRSGLLERLEGRILLVEQLPLHSRELLSQLLAYQEQLPEERRCTLIATTNPEEGAVASALLDKFDLFVELQPTEDLALRKRILSEALREPKAGEDATFLSLLEAARERLERMTLGAELLHYVAQVCAEPLTLGHRAELALARSALGWAAWQSKPRAERSDVDAVRQLALAHRWLETQPEPPAAEPPSEGAEDEEQQEAPEDSPQSPEEEQDKSVPEPDKVPEDKGKDEDEGEAPPPPTSDEDAAGGEAREATSDQPAPRPPHETEPTDSPAPPSEVRLQRAAEACLLHDPLGREVQRLRELLGSGRRLYSEQPSRRGRLGRVRPYSSQAAQLSLPATIRAAIPYQRLRAGAEGSAPARLSIRPEDYRSRQYRHRGGYHILFVLDVSGSMGVRERMSLVKGTILELLKEAYAKRDQVGLITFAQDEAELRLPFTHSAERAAQLMQDIRTGGRTPLWLAIERAAQYLDAERRRVAECLPVVLLLTDGRATSSQRSENQAARIAEAARLLQQRCHRCLVIDTESGFVRLGKARQLAERLEAEYYHLDELAQLRSLLRPH